MLFYNFNQPLATPGEVVNLGTAGTGYNLVLGALGDGRGGLHTTFKGAGAVAGEGTFGKPSFVARGAIPNKMPEPHTEPLVLYAAAGATIVISADGVPPVNYTAPRPFASTVELTVPTAGGGEAKVHVVPLEAPLPLPDVLTRQSSVEDRPLALRLLPGGRHTWAGETSAVVTKLPKNGQLFELASFEDRSREVPINAAGHALGPPHIVLFVPDLHAEGMPLDTFECVATHGAQHPLCQQRRAGHALLTISLVASLLQVRDPRRLITSDRFGTNDDHPRRHPRGRSADCEFAVGRGGGGCELRNRPQLDRCGGRAGARRLHHAPAE